jgi:hypothetical protein
LAWTDADTHRASCLHIRDLISSLPLFLQCRRGLEVALKNNRGKENQNQIQSAEIIPANEGEFMEKWARFESNMWSQFEDKMEEYKKTLSANKEKMKGSGLEIGELESDGEEVPVRSARVAGQKRSGVDALGDQAFNRESIDGLRESIEALRQQIKDTAANAVAPQYIPVPVMAPPTASIPTTAATAAAFDDRGAVSPKAPASKQSKRTPATTGGGAAGIAEKSTKKKTKVVQKPVEPEEAVPAPVPTPAADAVTANVPEVATSDKPADAEQPAASEPVTETVSETPAVSAPAETTTDVLPAVVETVAVESTDSGDDMVNVTFPFALNPDLASSSGSGSSSAASASSADNLIIPVQRDLAVDDLLLELRMVISHMVDVPLNRVSLVLNGKTIVLGLDVPADVSLTARNAAKMAASGELTAKILPAKADQKKPLKAAITDAQVDALVHRWEDEQLMGHIPVTAMMKKSFTRDQGKGIAKKRDWDDDKDLVSEEGLLGEPDETPWGSKEEVLLRRSLGSMLDDISDKEGLTDEEYEAKMKSLRKVVTKVPADISQRLR